MFTINLKDLPDEVVSYAFDQFRDRLGDTDTVMEHAQSVLDGYAVSEDTITFEQTIVTNLLADALHEKISDIEQEVRAGDREDFTIEEVQRMRMDVGYAIEDKSVEIDISQIDEKVLAYGSDQFPDRVYEDEIDEEIGEILAHEQIWFDYDDKQAHFNDFVLASLLRGALYEKTDDIAWEVRHGERDDYERREIRDVRHGIRQVFSEFVYWS